VSVTRRSHAAAAVAARIAQAGLDGLLVTRRSNVEYLAGFTGSTAAAFLSAGPGRRRSIVVDGRYVAQARDECPSWDLVKREGRLDEVLKGLVRGRVGFESEHVSHALHERLRSIEDVAWVPVKGTVEAVRAVKTPAEVEALRAACAALEDLFRRVLPLVRPGAVEDAVAREAERIAREATGEPPPFRPIVASGVRSALPHGIASSKEIEAGDLVVVDLGLRLDGYCADLTRTVVAGRADGRARDLHAAVAEANAAARAGVRAGLRGEEAHDVAAAVLRARGLGEAFGHGLGHGLGIEVHEEPRMAPKAEEILADGNAVTLEPGAYVEGLGGVRIEDMAVVRPAGVDVLSTLPRDLARDLAQ
jgi:Xaa-Pro aminopeptidase